MYMCGLSDRGYTGLQRGYISPQRKGMNKTSLASILLSRNYTHMLLYHSAILPSYCYTLVLLTTIYYDHHHYIALRNKQLHHPREARGLPCGESLIRLEHKRQEPRRTACSVNSPPCKTARMIKLDHPAFCPTKHFRSLSKSPPSNLPTYLFEAIFTPMVITTRH